MHKHHLKVVGFGLAVAGAVYGTASLATRLDLSETFDFQRINESIRDSLDDLDFAGSHVRELVWTFDPSATNIEEDRYKADVSLTVGGLAWTKAPVKATGSIQLEALAADESGKGGLAGGLQLTVQTDTLAMVKGLSQLASCPVSDTITGAKRVIELVDCAAIAKMADAKTMEELVVLFSEHVAEHATTMRQFVDDATATLPSVKNKILRHQITQELVFANQYLDVLKVLKITKGSTSIAMTADNIQLNYGGVTLTGFAMQLTPTSVTLKLAGKTAHGTLLYAAHKPEIERLLRDLESANSFAPEMIRMDARVWSNLIDKGIEAMAAR